MHSPNRYQKSLLKYAWHVLTHTQECLPTCAYLEARAQHWVSSSRALYLIYCHSISGSLKLAVLNRKNGQEESQIRLNTEDPLMGTGKQNSGHHTC